MGSSREISERLDSFVKQWPDDEERIQLLRTLAEFNGSIRLSDLAKKMGKRPESLARTVVGAVKDGLAQFTDGHSLVRISELGLKVASRYSSIPYR